MHPSEAVRPDERAANPYLPEIAADPVPFYETLRAQCPVAKLDGLDGTHVISRYEDVKFALRHPEIFSSALHAVDIGQDREVGNAQIFQHGDGLTCHRRGARPSAASRAGCRSNPFLTGRP